MSSRDDLAPDAILIGAPKAGTSALHAALARHPRIFATSPKEPKYCLCGDAPPPAYRGPGDAHSQQEWVWRRDDYQQLFAGAPADCVRIESTPFYLYSADARRRIAEDRIATMPPDNSRVFVDHTWRTRLLGRTIRLGAFAGSFAPPELWRTASRPLIAALQYGGHEQRPKLTSDERRELLGPCLDDIARLESVLGESFDDWRSVVGRGSFKEWVGPQ